MFSLPATILQTSDCLPKCLRALSIYKEKLNGLLYLSCYGLGFILELSIIHIEAKRKFLICCKICPSPKRQQPKYFEISFI
jgi:hypothetical protein